MSMNMRIPVGIVGSVTATAATYLMASAVSQCGWALCGDAPWWAVAAAYLLIADFWALTAFIIRDPLIAR